MADIRIPISLPIDANLRALADGLFLARVSSATGELTLTRAAIMGVVVHGSDDSVARPEGYTCVTWIGSVEPKRAAENDIWEDTSS